jgi:superoxide dismutase, Fe-Mn family
MKKFMLIVLCAFLFSDSNIAQLSQYAYPQHRKIERGTFVAKNYSNLLGKSKGLSDALLEMHIQFYEGYVKNTNQLSEAIDEMVNSGQDSTIGYGALKRRYGWEYDGMVLHELYFENLGGDGKTDSKSEIARQITSAYGSFDRFKQEFKATGMMRGIGWVVLAMGSDNRLHILWINEHAEGHLAGGTPLLVMDVWEHAYITEYGTNRGKYIDVFFDNINWNAVNSRIVRTPASSRS